MLHKGIEYDVQEDVPGLWRWIIHQKMEPDVIGEPKFRRREAAVAACIEEINGIERLSSRSTSTP